MRYYRVLRRMYVNPGEIVTLGTVDPAGIPVLIEKGIVESVLEDERDEEVDDGD